MVTLRYLDLLVQKDNLQKSQFFKDLTAVVSKLPKVFIQTFVFSLHVSYRVLLRAVLYDFYAILDLVFNL